MENVIIGDTIQWRLFIPKLAEMIYETLDSNEGRASFWAESAIEKDVFIDFKFINGTEYRSKI